MDGSHSIVQEVCAVPEHYNPSVILQVQRDYVISNEDCDRRNCMRQELKQHDDFRSLVRVTVRSTMNRNYHIETVTQMPKCWLGISTPLPLSSDLRRPPSPLQRWQPNTHTRKCLACAVGSVGLGVAFEASQLVITQQEGRTSILPYFFQGDSFQTEERTPEGQDCGQCSQEWGGQC